MPTGLHPSPPSDPASACRSEDPQPLPEEATEDPRRGLPPSPQPPERPAPRAGAAAEVAALGRYLIQSEVHTYAFSVAANAILSLFPFIVLLYTLASRVFRSPAMESVIGEMVHFFLPTGQNFVVRNMALVARRHDVQLISLFMLFVSSTGIFLPLEVALNQVWRVSSNRSFLANQAVSFALAMLMAVLAMGSVMLNAAQRAVLSFLFLYHTDNRLYRLAVSSLLGVSTAFAGVVFFFAIYWILPNRRLPVRAVLPTAVGAGVLWQLAKFAYIAALPYLDLQAVYGPFAISVGLMMWAYVSGLIMLAGAHYSASRHALGLARQAEIEAAAAAG